MIKKEERLQVYQMYDGHCAYCGKPIKYEDMQVDHFIAKNRGCYSRWDSKEGKYIITHGKDSIENYMPSCRACNFKKKDMNLEQFRDAIRYQDVYVSFATSCNDKQIQLQDVKGIKLENNIVTLI